MLHVFMAQGVEQALNKGLTHNTGQPAYNIKTPGY